jgi:hypothetical protein
LEKANAAYEVNLRKLSDAMVRTFSFLLPGRGKFIFRNFNIFILFFAGEKNSRTYCLLANGGIYFIGFSLAHRFLCGTR